MTLRPLARDEPDDLRSRVSGPVLGAGDAGFDEARAVWNAMIDSRPTAIVRAADVGDIAKTIAFSRERGLELAVRGGGHNVAGAGTVDGEVVLDLGDPTAVSVDPSAQRFEYRAGRRWRTSTRPPSPTAWSCRSVSSPEQVSAG